MTLSLVQQHLLSYFNLCSVSSLKSTLKIFDEIITKVGIDVSPTSERITWEVLQINKTIQKYDLEIVETFDEISCEKLFILVHTANNTMSQRTKFYDENTSQLFSRIVKDCVLSDKGHISETYCLNLSSDLKMTKSAVQTALEKLIADKWLVSMDDKISLGMRSIAELQQNIRQHYPDDVKNCHFCKLIVIQGCICSHCKTKTHRACLKKYFTLSKSKYICPNCKGHWNDANFTNLEDEPCEPGTSYASSAGPPKKRTRRSCVAD